VRNRQVARPSKLDEAAYKSTDEVFELLGTSAAGLSEDEAATRLEEAGPNEVAYEKKKSWSSSLGI
jgi:magnesium-transporting ATPase (P-type)